MPGGQGQLVAFLGLGRMGYRMAARLAAKHAKIPGVLVWNRTPGTAHRHAAEHGSHAVGAVQDLAQARVVFLCLPNSEVVQDVLVDRLGPLLNPGTVVVDATSGCPSLGREVARTLASWGVAVLDAPVSGGPGGAAAGTLTSMIGGEAAALQTADPYIRCYSQRLVHAGTAPGSGHALKAVNNLLNAAHLLAASEGLLALRNCGVEPSVALAAINGSSGRSFPTELQLPGQVLTRKFAHGFAAKHMSKDVRIGASIIRGTLPHASLLPHAAQGFLAAARHVSSDDDYTCVIKHLEHLASAELHAAAGSGTSEEA